MRYLKFNTPFTGFPPMSRRLRLIQLLMAVAALYVLPACHAAHSRLRAGAQNPDQIFIALRAAAHKNDAGRALELAAQIPDYPVPSYLDYFTIKARLDAPDAPVLAFLKKYAGTAIADRMRNDYLLVLGARRAWRDFEAHYPQFALDDDPQVKCYALIPRAMRGEDIAQKAHALLRIAPKKYGEGCTDLVMTLAQQASSRQKLCGRTCASPMRWAKLQSATGWPLHSARNSRIRSIQAWPHRSPRVCWSGFNRIPIPPRRSLRCSPLRVWRAPRLARRRRRSPASRRNCRRHCAPPAGAALPGVPRLNRCQMRLAGIACPKTHNFQTRPLNGEYAPPCWRATGQWCAGRLNPCRTHCALNPRGSIGMAARLMRQAIKSARRRALSGLPQILIFTDSWPLKRWAVPSRCRRASP